MGVRKLKPMTPGQRRRSVSDFDTITKSTPEKSLTAPLKRSGGRNNSGRMTVRQRGGGHKRRYRIVDFKRDKVGDLPTEMVFHFFKSFSDASMCNLNIKAEGDNEHHKIESIFKAFAKAIKMAKKEVKFKTCPNCCS